MLQTQRNRNRPEWQPFDHTVTIPRRNKSMMETIDNLQNELVFTNHLIKRLRTGLYVAGVFVMIALVMCGGLAFAIYALHYQ